MKAGILATSQAFLGLIPAPAAQSPRIPAYVLERDVVIDAAANDFSPISWVAVGTNGTIAISQEQDHLVRFFSARGLPAGSFGRKGKGPGEFGAMQLFGWLGDTLWVGDMEVVRFTLIGPDARLASVGDRTRRGWT